MGNFFSKHRLVILYGASLAAVLLLLKWLEFRFIIMDHSFEVYIGAIALVFTGLGIWLARKLFRPGTQTIIVEKEVFVTRPAEELTSKAGEGHALQSGEGLTLAAGEGRAPNEKVLSQSGISKREWEVLALIAEGLSNQEIADRLFVSLNTIKTHSSNLFEKLDVKRRTQAIEKGKKLGLLG